MKTRLIIFFSVSILLTHCGDRRTKEFFRNYGEVRSEFPHDLTDHFPLEFKTIGQLEAVTPGGAYAYQMAFLCLSIKTDSTELVNLERRLKKLNIKPFSPSDTTLIIVGDTEDYSKKIMGTPIPSFSLYEKDLGLNSVRLDKEFSIYVLESISGEYMTKENLTTKNKVPINWKKWFFTRNRN